MLAATLTFLPTTRLLICTSPSVCISADRSRPQAIRLVRVSAPELHDAGAAGPDRRHRAELQPAAARDVRHLPGAQQRRAALQSYRGQHPHGERERNANGLWNRRGID